MKKMAFEGGHYKKKSIKGVLINEVVEFKRKKRADDKAKESREIKGKSYEDFLWIELCEDVTKLKMPQ